ncbi:MAG: GNAT family N-acetyltransferase [Acidobacteriia bacterium]|nr:GNAT family N-acetyltransferase [Terriglobia bacterium]
MHATPEARNIGIRAALPRDAAQIAVLAGQLGYPATREEIARRLGEMNGREVQVVLVAEAQGRVIGWAHIAVEGQLVSDTRAELRALVVAEEQRSGGVGRRLLEAAENWARAQGCGEIGLRSNVLRERAHPFYVRHGYEQYKTQKVFRKKL